MATTYTDGKIINNGHIITFPSEGGNIQIPKNTHFYKTHIEFAGKHPSQNLGFILIAEIYGSYKIRTVEYTSDGNRFWYLILYLLNKPADYTGTITIPVQLHWLSDETAGNFPFKANGWTTKKYILRINYRHGEPNDGTIALWSLFAGSSEDMSIYISLGSGTCKVTSNGSTTSYLNTGFLSSESIRIF